MGQAFNDLVASLTQKGVEWHRETILRNSRLNVQHIVHTLRSIKPDQKPCLIVSAGPSLHRENMLARIHSKFNGTIVAVDAAYVACLRAGIVPDYVLTLDPHPNRVVRWFGDPEIEAHSTADEYFKRQDLDVAFRENSGERNKENIYLVDRHKVPLIIATCAPAPVVSRTHAHRRFWFTPLVDDPNQSDSITRQIVDATDCPAMNSGGTVGTAAFIFAQCILKSQNIAVVGMDFGYPIDLPLEQTQEWNMLKNEPGFERYFPIIRGPWGDWRTSPTYFYYRGNLLDLLEANDLTLTNCTGGGLLFGDLVRIMEIEKWLS